MKALNVIYDDLDYKSGVLLPATDKPIPSLSANDWIEKGEWLTAAKKAGVDKMFFIGNNPVAVFAQCIEDLEEKIKAFNKIWCLARPRILFLATPGELNVLDLARGPVHINNENRDQEQKEFQSKSLKILRDLTKVAQELQDYHRDNIESGRVFEKGRFGDIKNRADKALINDLKSVRRELIQAGLSGENLRFAHALIGRSIFIRYLEDRKILSEDYFEEVARKRIEWMHRLKNPTSREKFDFTKLMSLYPRVLESKEFTYELFRALAHDFNGDMFPDVDEEEKAVTEHHLNLIQDLLYGDTGIQKQLFFFSYQFDIVPLDLISSIYEEFYHPSTDEDEKKNKVRQDGAYYTPPVLAEFVVSRVLDSEVLKNRPRVLDPACGSGIFLVEAFRRMVRYEWQKKNDSLTFDELKLILKNQIAGIEVNKEAARIAAFSLNLAMLNYLEPPSINEQIKLGNKLPNLLATGNRGANHYNCIWIENTFDTETIRDDVLLQKRFGNGCADVVVGNPPWSSSGNKGDEDAKQREKVMLEWCEANRRPIGFKDPSQAFLWRTLDFLKENGRAGMLVLASVLFKHSSRTQEFRNHWMNQVCLKEVFNFSHVRDFFFKGANSPFMMISFQKSNQQDNSVEYWSVKQVSALKNTQAVLLSKYDRQVLRNLNLSDNKTWKVFWFGRHVDYTLIHRLENYKQLSWYIDRKNSGRGYEYERTSKRKDATQLENFKSLNQINSRYGECIFDTPPKSVYILGALGSYSGLRILVNEGISENKKSFGNIIAQFFMEPFCFYRKCYGLKLKIQDINLYKLLLGIIWSSLTKYYFFNTTANWGLWHHKILLDELLQLPVILDTNHPMASEIINIVDKLRTYNPQKQDVIHPDGVPEAKIEAQRRKWEAELDEAVFELYGLTVEQKDLIRDCCEVTIPFFYQPYDSIGAQPAVKKGDYSWIETYVRIFARRWNTYLDSDTEMRAEVHLGAHENMLAVEFFPRSPSDPWNPEPKTDTWDYLLEGIGNALPQPMGTSQILLDGVVHVVTDNSIIIIKRNEKRFWTRSLAREDADATLCKRMAGDIHEGKVGG
jgi:type I restriction-modification system DNA methylase subunit